MSTSSLFVQRLLASTLCITCMTAVACDDDPKSNPPDMRGDQDLTVTGDLDVMPDMPDGALDMMVDPAQDMARDMTQDMTQDMLSSTLPVWNSSDRLTITPTDTGIRLSWPSAMDSDLIAYDVLQNSVRVSRLPATRLQFELNDLLPDTAYSFEVVAIDQIGQRSPQPLSASYMTQPDGMMNGSRDVFEPAHPPSLDTLIDDLISGPTPRQRDVIPGALEPRRQALFSGQVLDVQGNPVPNVRVHVHKAPELGYTLTDAEGHYDIVLNGGGEVHLDFARDQYLRVQRSFASNWRNMEDAGTVVLTMLDAKMTRVDTTQEAAIAQSSEVTDDSGPRKVTLIFKQGTSAEMVMPGGMRLPVQNLDVRMTEYTVGARGIDAMPGTLPPTSAYTYAASLTLDEALNQGAERVEFNQPVAFYVTNFLNMFVGETVPLGYYDYGRAKWVAEPNGIVLKIVGTSMNEALLDTDGDDVADDVAVLDALGIDAAERRRLATTFATGDELWRSSVTHFTPYDCNWGLTCGDTPCDEPDSQIKEDKGQKDCGTGSVVECRKQILRESIPVTGTGMSLNYSTYNQYGYSAKRMVELDWLGSRTSAAYPNVAISVGGQYIGGNPQGQGNPVKRVWDGRLSDGRRYDAGIRGGAAVTFCSFLVRASTGSFALPARGRMNASRGPGANRGYEPGSGAVRCSPEFLSTLSMLGNVLGTTRINDKYPVLFDSWTMPTAHLGGWSLDVWHHFDPVSQTLHLGTGGRRETESYGNSVYDSVGRLNDPLTNVGQAYDPGTPRLDSTLDAPESIAAGPDGSLYITDTDLHRVLRAMPDGTIRSIAGVKEDTVGGSRKNGFNGDGQPATFALLNEPTDVAVASDGSAVYIADKENNRIRKIDEFGQISTLVGAGTDGLNTSRGLNDAANGDAFQSLTNWPTHVAVAPSGMVYYSDSRNHCIRAITQSGKLHTIVGICGEEASEPSSASDDLSAVQAKIHTPGDLVFKPDGGFYFIERDVLNSSIRYVASTGVISTVATHNDLEQKTLRHLSYDKRNDSLMVTTRGRIFQVKSGKVTRIMGAPDTQINPTPSSAALTNISEHIQGVVVAPDDSIYYVEKAASIVREMKREFGDNSGEPRITVPDESGETVFIFDSNGLHLETRNVRDNKLIYRFGYTPEGLLDRVIDDYGETIYIERAADGVATTIRAPNGQRTRLIMHPPDNRQDGARFLATVFDPLQQRHDMTYNSAIADAECESDGSNCEGLLKSISMPNGRITTFTYDELGRLEEERNNLGFSRALNESDQSTPSEKIIMETSALGRVTRYGSTQTDAAVVSWFEDTAGHRISTSIGSSGAAVTTYPEGHSREVTIGYDEVFESRLPYISRTVATRPSGKTLITEYTTKKVLKDPDNRLDLLSETRLYTSIADGTTRTLEVDYDGVARTLTQRSPGGRSYTAYYRADALDVERIEQPARHPIDFTYDSKGRVETQTQGNRRVSYTYDALGYMESMQFSDPTMAFSSIYAITYENDVLGRAVKKTMTNGTTFEYEYNAANEIIKAQPMNGQGAISIEYNTQHQQTDIRENVIMGQAARTQFTHDADNLASSMILADGRAITYAFDPVTAKPLSVTTPEAEYIFATNPITGQLDTIQETDGVLLAFERDGVVLTGETIVGKGLNTSIDYDVNARNQHTSYTLQGSHTIAMTYDDDDQPLTIGDMVFTRDPAHWDLLGTTLEQVQTDYTYSLYGDQESSTTSHMSTGILLGWTQQFDMLGRVVSRSLNDMSDEGFFYNPTGQLAVVSKNGMQWASYTYDEAGNRISSQEDGVMTSATYDPRNRIQTWGARQYEFNDVGHMSEITDQARYGGTLSFEHGTMGNLRRVTLSDNTEIKYIVGPRGRRLGKLRNDVLEHGFIYKGMISPVAMTGTDGATIESEFVYGTHMHSPDYMIRSGVRYRMVKDYIGSIRKVVNASTGEVVQEIEYAPFGEVLMDTNPGFQPFGFAGGLTDQDTDLVHFGAREYDPVAGRWTSPDPAGLRGGHINMYTYANNNPVNFVDPTGRAAWFVPMILWGLASFVVDAGVQWALTGSFDCINWSHAAAAGLIGAIGGAFSTLLTAGLAVRVGTNFNAIRALSTSPLHPIKVSKLAMGHGKVLAKSIAQISAINGGVSAVAGGLTQGTKNALTNRQNMGTNTPRVPLSKGVGSSALVGGATGVFGGAMGSRIGAQHGLTGEVIGGAIERIPIIIE